MKSTTTMEAPAETGTASATPELFAHTWDAQGVCENPEAFAVDGMPKDTSVVIRLGMGPDGKWRSGWKATKGASAIGMDRVCLDYPARATRAEALENALYFVGKQLFAKDKRVLKIFAAVIDKLQAGQAAERSPANTEEPAAMPQPEPAEVAVAAIAANPLNERERPKEYIDELAESIAREGLLQRIGVVLLAPAGDSLPGVPPEPRYRLVYGGCRLKAVTQLGQRTIRAEVYPATLTPRQESRLIAVENLKRLNPNPIEQAKSYDDHMRSYGLTQDEMAREIGKSRPVIANAIRLLGLPLYVQELLAEGKLTAAHGVALLRFKPDDKDADKFPNWPSVVTAIAQLVVRDGLAASVVEDVELLLNESRADDLLDELGHDVACVANTLTISGPEFVREAEEHPAYFESEEYGLICFAPAHWDDVVKRSKAAQKEAAKAEKEKQEKKAEKQKKSAGRYVNNLPKGSYVQLGMGSVEADILLSLLPDETVEDLKYYDWSRDTTTICTRPQLATKVGDAILSAVDADRKAKLGPLLDAAKKKIAAIKKIGPREITMMLVANVVSWGYGQDPTWTSPESLKRQGVKLGGIDTKKGISLAEVAKADQAGLLRAWLDDIFSDITPENLKGRQNERAFLRFLLDVEDLGLLEETKAGQKQIAAQIAATDWYKKELVAIELEAAKAKSPTTQSGKAAKKGGGK